MLDDQTRRRDFPSLEATTYLNTAAEGVPPLAVRESLLAYFADKQQGAAGRPQHFAQWEEARARAAEMIGLSAAEVGICSCSSEAYNLLAAALQLNSQHEVIINDLDFPAGRTPWLQPSCPATVKLWRSRDGALRVEDLAELLGPRTRLVSTSLVSYFNGFMIDLPAVVDVVRKKSGALLAVDITQALGRVPLNLAGVDWIVSSTHKWILAAHGGGIVGVPAARAAQLTVPAGGWFNLESPFERAADEPSISKPGAASFMVGMPNFPAIYAIRAALGYLAEVGPASIDRHARPLVHQCLEGLARLPVELMTPTADRHLAGIVAFRCANMEAVYEALGDAGIQVMHSAGRLRVSLHGYNTSADVEKLLGRLGQYLR